MSKIAIVDLFAGPGGLGEGFSAFNKQAKQTFSVALSIEKDLWAHRTLQLRAFTRLFLDGLPYEYFALLAGELALEQLFTSHPVEARIALEEARLLELGAQTAAEVRSLVASRVDDDSPWILVGGPPCQAYSLIGRARNAGNADYVAERDHRQKLYVEYLQVLADHAPPVFVMENVKGLLSAQLAGEGVFGRIREDLEDPASALKREGRKASSRRPRYTLRSLVASDSLFGPDRASDFLVRSEDFGVPQTRHRVILLGVREDLSHKPERFLVPQKQPRTVGQTLKKLPRLRSGLSEGDADSGETWLKTVASASSRSWFHKIPTEVQCAIHESLCDLRVPSGKRGANHVPPRKNGGSAVLNHATRSHIVGDLDRYLFASCFAQVNDRSPTLADFPSALMPDHVSAGNSTGHFSDRFRVQVKNHPSSTITSHISKDGHYYIHPDPRQCRSLTVREAARLQTFPDDYFFCGPRTSQYQQVGNAVPPELARQIAEMVADLIGS